MSLWPGNVPVRPPSSPPPQVTAPGHGARSPCPDLFLSSLQELIPTKPQIFHPGLCTSPVPGAHRAGELGPVQDTKPPVWVGRAGLAQTQSQDQPHEEEEESSSSSEDWEGVWQQDPAPQTLAVP